MMGAIVEIQAADDPVTLNGVGLCAKCALGETDSCQNAIKLTAVNLMAF